MGKKDGTSTKGGADTDTGRGHRGVGTGRGHRARAEGAGTGHCTQTLARQTRIASKDRDRQASSAREGRMFDRNQAHQAILMAVEDCPTLSQAYLESWRRIPARSGASGATGLSPVISTFHWASTPVKSPSAGNRPEPPDAPSNRPQPRGCAWTRLNPARGL